MRKPAVGRRTATVAPGRNLPVPVGGLPSYEHKVAIYKMGDETMKKMFLALTLVGGLLSFPVVASMAQETLRQETPGQESARANLEQINRSGIRARLEFTDDGNTLTVQGTARGLDPSKAYVSLVYDPGSVARGPRACLPTDDSLSFPQMVLGPWVVAPDGTGLLNVVKTGSTGAITDYASLDDIGTVSVRQDTQPGQPLPPAPDPNRFVLQACGRVR